MLYGSYAKGTTKPDSDVDIALLYDAQHIPSSLELWELKQKLDNALSREVDLICLNSADPIIGNQIYKHHQVILINEKNGWVSQYSNPCL